jgi:hypothetical protein
MCRVFHDNKPGGIENATHNTSGEKSGYFPLHVQCIVGCILYSAGLIITREYLHVLGHIMKSRF